MRDQQLTKGWKGEEKDTQKKGWKRQNCVKEVGKRKKEELYLM
jgi:hypothetical protein